MGSSQPVFDNASEQPSMWNFQNSQMFPLSPGSHPSAQLHQMQQANVSLVKDFWLSVFTGDKRMCLDHSGVQTTSLVIYKSIYWFFHCLLECKGNFYRLLIQVHSLCVLSFVVSSHKVQWLSVTKDLIERNSLYTLLWGTKTFETLLIWNGN